MTWRHDLEELDTYSSKNGVPHKFHHDTCPYLVGLVWPDDDDGGAGDTIAIDF